MEISNIISVFKEGRGVSTNIEETLLKGIPSSPGYAIGKAVVMKSENIAFPNEIIDKSKVDDEIARLEQAIIELTNELNRAIDKIKDQPGNIVSIVETNSMILNDPLMKESLISRIKNGNSVETAVILEFDEKMQFFKRSKDRILKERGYELEHLKERLFDILKNRRIIYSIAKDAILIVRSLTPADLINFKDAGILGLVTEVGGIASHVSILARSFEIPSVIGIKYATEKIIDSSELIIDGYTGTLFAFPTQSRTEEYQNKKNAEENHKKQLGELVKLPSETKDKVHIDLFSNIDTLEEIESSFINGAEGVGLVRTEHLILSMNAFPNEEIQYQWYRELAQRAYPYPVIIRAFDLGSDKHAEGLPMHEENPALGLRGIRFLLSRKDIFADQINAVLRASKNRNIKFMLPMISSIEELEQSLELIEECKTRISSDLTSFDRKMPVGVMIETPAAALLSDKLAEISDFFSIGTNDLTQYTLAADRNNQLVSNIFNSFHPSILILIKQTAEAARSKKKTVGVCGEFAGHPASTSLLIGMGINQLSVTPPILPELKSRTRQISYKESVKLAKRILRLSSQAEVREALMF